MAAVGLGTCRSWSSKANVWPTVRSRSYAAMAVKSKQKPSGSQTSPTPRGRDTSSPKGELQSSDGQAKKSKSPSSLESAAEQNLRAMESMKRFTKMYATADVWGTEMASLDVGIPYDLRLMFRSLTTEPMFAPSKFSDIWYGIKYNTSNWMKNSYSMFVMAKANAFPGRNVVLRVKTLGRILSIRNNSPDALLAPLRQIALDTYRKVNTSVARGHEGTVKEFTSGPFQEKTIKAMRRRERGQAWAWSITSDVSDATLFPKSKKRRAPTPVDIVSVRAGEVYTENAEPANGHRLLIQALVKFDTTQRIDIIDKRGQAVNSDLAGPRKVVQYLLLEKVGWYDTPWKIKDQLHKA
ncbi:hypothetical protein JVT61DRAFT_10563 [Boletus reticuloceps]|uniref:Tim44-like domain-containing protein n=1 Tax=Boletus reticuloceps TaxID=495285 RepID=A0A8I2YV38_9AGAM|nr:hypothetical protein JVT61DRAFT_10563 [Boletus reticuloceps]